MAEARTDTYTCAHCGGTFRHGWSDDEAKAEARDVFGVDPDEDRTMAIICDDCYRELRTWMDKQQNDPRR